MTDHAECNGAQILLNCLENEDVDYIFGLPGEQTVPILHEFEDADIEFVVSRHEQGAAFMADVYGRLTGKAGVCLSTLGPGATNLLTGVTDAQLDGAPVVALTSQRSQDELHKQSHQYIDVTTVFQEVTKWNETVRAPETIPEIVRKAFSVAESEKPGATHIELPEDVTMEEAAVEPLSKEGPSQSGSRPSDIEGVIDQLQAAENPIILAGNEVIRAEGAEQLTAFAEATGIPVVTTFMGKGAISARHNLSVGTIGFQEEDYSLCGLEGADTVLVVGMDYIEYDPANWNEDKDKDIVYLGSNPPEIDSYYQTEQVLTGDVARLLEQLVEAAEDVR
ncbi:MAG: thiamine pyrophosphate-binding protein, partial [Candidatus Nanohaloarchaea archaeon]|nr:thiamine pyrophosphate-binding protein [Candidatus Nanohaloarchaea archaeon]